MTAAGSETLGVRLARLDDAAAIGRIQSESWRSTYAGLLPDPVLLRMTPERQARSWRNALRDMRRRPMGLVHVATAGLRIIGFGSCGREQTGTLGLDGEVYTLYVDDTWHGRGAGRLLLTAMFGRLRREGRASAAVWVLDGNPARWFYEAMGGRLVAERRGREWGVDIAERAYGWRDLAGF